VTASTATAWRRKGLVVEPPAAASHAWWASCAGIPTCLPLHDRLWRIWFGGRDAQGRAGVLCADVDPADDMRVLAMRDVPGLERGGEGAFDSAGLWASAALEVDGRILLWYTGMRLGREVPHELAIGLACSEDGGLTFRKVGAQPVLSSGEPGFATTPCVRRLGTGFEMWYSAGTGWVDSGNGLEPTYDIRRAVSSDGVDWIPDPFPVVALGGTAWAGLTRPWVEAGADTIWFSARGAGSFREPSAQAYRLQRAPLWAGTVPAGAIETLRLEPPPRPGDWDGWMQTCACIVPFGETRVMFYNGNGFSRTGFGYAVEEPVR
jgi:hypothetical protein